jgi:hypothetical protein
MSPSLERATAARAPAPRSATLRALWWISTKNPFYVISAGFFLVGLWLSFGNPEKVEDTLALMTGLAGYTVLLAATSVVLIRFARVWDDARTVLLLVVLMFLTTSVTFDHVLVFDVQFGNGAVPWRGIICNCLGLVIAIYVSEVVLWAVGIWLPWCYRVPYYLLLALFFLYPLGLAPFVADHHGPVMMWGLFAFSSVAGLIFLTLIPAVRQGSKAVRLNGSPWPWPLFPWTLFALLACAVPARAILLCYSMHLIGVKNLYDMTFGPYFLVPLGLAFAILLLEAGFGSKRREIVHAAMFAPSVLIGLTMIGHRSETIYVEFLDMFTKQLHADPVYCSLVLAAAYYAYASLRRAPWAIEGLTTTFLALTCLDTKVLMGDAILSPKAAPLMIVSTLFLGAGVWRQKCWLCLVGSLGLIASVMLTIADDAVLAPYRWWISLHLAVVVMMVLSVAFDDRLANALRVIGPGLLLILCLQAILLPGTLPESLPKWVVDIHPLVMAALLAGFGVWRWHWPTVAIAGFILAAWLIATGAHFYRLGRQRIVGFDYLAVSLVVFILALGISLAKSGVITRWCASWLEEEQD